MKKIVFLFVTLLTFALAHTAKAQESTIALNVNKNTGTASESTGFFRTWTSNAESALPGVTFQVQSNNRNIQLDDCTETKMAIYPGGGGCTYVIGLPAGYRIKSYSFDAQSVSQVHTITIGSQAYEIPTGSTTHVSVENVKTQTASFALSGGNSEVSLTNFVINIQTESDMAKASVLAVIGDTDSKSVFIKSPVTGGKYVYAAANDLTINANTGVLKPTEAVFTFHKVEGVEAPENDTYIGTYKIFSEKQQGYVQRVDPAQYQADAESATQWHVFAVTDVQNGVFITTNTNLTAHNCWNASGGANATKIATWSNDAGSKMVVEIAPTDFTQITAGLEAQLADYDSHPNDIFYPTEAKREAMRTAINSLKTQTPTTYEEMYNAYNAVAESIAVTANDVNLPQPDVKYYINNMYDRQTSTSGNSSVRMAAVAGHNVKTNRNNNNATRNVWIFEQGETEGDYYIKNAVTEEYLQAATQSAQVKLGATKVAYIIVPLAAGTVGYGAFKTKSSGGYGHLHYDGSGNVVGWGANSTASNWKLTPVTDEEAAAAAEQALTTTETSGNEIIAEQLGVALGSPTSLKDYMDGAKASLYEKASGNVYRIKMASPNSNDGRVLGTYTITSTDDAGRANTMIPRAIENPDNGMADNKSKSIDVLWQLKKVPGEESFKIVHYNTSATGANALCTVGPVQNGNAWNIAAVLTTEDNGCKYQLAVKNSANKTVEFVSEGKHINFSGNASFIGILNQWSGDNNNVVLQKIEEVEIPLTQIEASNGSFATVCLPFDIESIEGANAAYLHTINEKHTAVSVEEFPGGIPAKQGAILVGANATDQVATLKIGAAATALDENANLLEGITTKLNELDNNFTYFTLSRNAAQQVGMRKFTNSKSTGIEANKAFIKQTTGASSISFLNFLLDDLTAVDGMETTAAKATGVIYDLQGRKVTNPTKGGIYIQNGKKIVF